MTVSYSRKPVLWSEAKRGSTKDGQGRVKDPWESATSVEDHRTRTVAWRELKDQRVANEVWGEVGREEERDWPIEELREREEGGFLVKNVEGR